MDIPSSKRRKIRIPPPPRMTDFVWNSPFNLEGKISICKDNELGDGATSRVYLGTIKAQRFAVKCVKGYLPHHAHTLVDSYENCLHMSHPKVVSVLGLCPNSGYIVLELCEKCIHGHTVHTLVDVMGLYNNDLPMDLKVLALLDIVEGLTYLHSKAVVHGDLKPLNILVSGSHEDDFVFKVTDYASSNLNLFQLSHSTTFKQLMTPSYTAPELFAHHGAHTPEARYSSDVYSFGILAYEVFFGQPPWPKVNMSLIENVKAGHRPVIPSTELGSCEVSSLIQECWQHDPDCRPTAISTFEVLNCYYAKMQTCSESDEEFEPASTESLVDDDDLCSGYNEVEDTYSYGKALSPPESGIELSSAPSLLSNEISSSPPPSQSTSSELVLSKLESIKAKLKIKAYKQFQVEAVQAVQLKKDVVVVQPTGSGKSLCYMASSLLNPGKVTLVIEPLVAIITDQVRSLRHLGLDVVALGSTAGYKDRTTNYKRVFESSLEIPQIAFCTPEYLFGTEGNGSYPATDGQFSALKQREEVLNLIVIDEAHKIFDRMPSFRPSFDRLRELKELRCSLLAMSATLSDEQIKTLKDEFLHGSHNCIVLARGVQRDNLKLHLRKYQYKKPTPLESSSHERDEEISTDEEDHDDNVVSAWRLTVDKIKDVIGGQQALVYLDYARDVEQVVDVFHHRGVKACKYTGKMKVDDRCESEKSFREGRTSVLVATESFELGVNNPNIAEVIRVGSPRSLGVLLQEFGRAGRTIGMVANAYLFFNETVDDKRLGLWLKSSFESHKDNAAHEKVKEEILSTYCKTWQFVYSCYHGKCLMWALSHFYEGADDVDSLTCFTANASLCMMCELSEVLCEMHIDIKSHLCTLLDTVKQLHCIGLNTVTKTLLVGTLMGANSQYIEQQEPMHQIIDKPDTCWGSGVFVGGIRMGAFAWHKIICVAVHLSFLELSFNFRPFDNHIEVHRRLTLSSAGECFLAEPTAVMSLNPLSTTIDRWLSSSKDAVVHKKIHNRGAQIKPRIIQLLEDRQWTEGTPNQLKYIGYKSDGRICDEDVCFFFHDCKAFPEATSDPHYLSKLPQLCRSQATVKKIEVIIDAEPTTLFANRSYCSGVKRCAGDKCTYTVSNKQKVNRCKDHLTSSLVSSGPCCCHIAYLYPEDFENDNRRWFMALCSQNSEMHNHPPPSEWKITPRVLSDISNAISQNSQLTPKEIQKGLGLNYSPMEVSVAASNIDRLRAKVNKSKKDTFKVDNDKINPLKIIDSFPSIKEKIDRNNIHHSLETDAVDKMVGKYQLDGDSAYSFTRDRRFAYFQSPFQATHWAKGAALFVDIDYTSNHHFPYLLNIVCINEVTTKYMACGRALMNRQDGYSIGTALSTLVRNVKEYVNTYDITTTHKEILLDFDEAEASGFRDAFGEEITNLIRGCSVHFIRSSMRVAKQVNPSTSSAGYQLFMAIAKLIPDNSNKDEVMLAFRILSGEESYTRLRHKLPTTLCSQIQTIDTSTWTITDTWVEWWTRPSVLKKLSKAFSFLTEEDWDDLPGTNNPVESINSQSVPSNTKSVSLRPLVEHIYLEDRRQACLEVATSRGVTISYRTKKVIKRNRRPAKAPEKRTALLPRGKKAIGLRVSVEYYVDESQSTTKWYKGTVIAYSRKMGYTISYDGCGPEDNEVVHSLKQGIEKGDIKMI